MQSSSEKARRVKRFAGTSFDEQLQVIADSGIKLAKDRVDEIRSIVAEDKELYDEDPILFLLNVIASKDDEGTQYSSNICLFDAECIYKDGDYKAIVDDLAAICEGQMPGQHTEDWVEFSEDDEGGRGKAHVVQFDLDGKSHKFKLKVDKDWVDPSIFDKIGTLFSKRTNGAKALWYLNFGGQISEQFACRQTKQKYSKTKRCSRCRWFRRHRHTSRLTTRIRQNELLFVLHQFVKYSAG